MNHALWVVTTQKICNILMTHPPYVDSGNFIALPRQDNSANTQYNHRYLDALANLLLVDREDDKQKSKLVVAAVCKYQDKHYFSFNSNDSQKSANGNVTDLQRKRVEAVIKMIKSKDESSLLSHNLLNNYSLFSRLEIQLQNTIEEPKQELRKEDFSTFQEVDEFEAFFFAAKKRQDTQNKSQTDALRIFKNQFEEVFNLVKKQVVLEGVLEKADDVYQAIHKHVNTVAGDNIESTLNKIAQILEKKDFKKTHEKDSLHKDFTTTYKKLNKVYQALCNNINTTIDDKPMIEPSALVSLLIEETNKKYIEEQTTLANKNKKQLVDKYTKLFSDIDSLGVDGFEILNKLKLSLLKPLQDVKKLLVYLKEQDKEFECELLINKSSKGLHAEVYLKSEFPDLKELPYIGISKLCCACCHEVFEKSGDGHRGTHGMYYDYWWINMRQYHEIKEQVLDKKTNNLEYSCDKDSFDRINNGGMDGNLSDDEEIEEDIMIGSDVSLWMIKQTLNPTPFQYQESDDDAPPPPSICSDSPEVTCLGV